MKGVLVMVSKRSHTKLLSIALACTTAVGTLTMPFSFALTAHADTTNTAVSIGEPTFKNTGNLASVLNPGVNYTAGNMLKDIFDNDVANAKGSINDYYMDRILQRPGVANGSQSTNGNSDGNALMTRGRALYMYTHNPAVIGFGGYPGYTQEITKGDLYDITFSSNGSNITSTENTAKRINAPSYWTSTYSLGSNLTATENKFITDENVAVTTLDITNSSSSSVNLVMNVSSVYVSNRSQVTVNGTAQNELTGSLVTPTNLTTVTPRLTGDGLNYVDSSSNTLSGTLTVPAGGTISTKVLMSFATSEIPESVTDYIRYAGYNNTTAVAKQQYEYNEWWYQNIPYIDIPDKAVEKAVAYRWWDERFNQLDANIPGYDYQYPTTIEGVLGYNNAIMVSQPMQLQDAVWFRNSSLPYGMILSVGNSSKSSAFLDNPGDLNNWNNHYGQYIATEGLEAYKIKGGPTQLASTMANYFADDAQGQLDLYGNHTSTTTPTNYLISYQNAYMTGNDAATVSSFYPKKGTWVAYPDNAYVYGAAQAASTLYSLVGNTSKATQFSTLAGNVQNAVLTYLWSDKNSSFESRAMSPASGFNNNGDGTDLIPWKEQNNFNYFSENVVPTDPTSADKYDTMLAGLDDGAQYPIWPCITSNQADYTAAVAAGITGMQDNFSNIDFTVRARAYEAALHTYDRSHQYVTPQMLKLSVDWQAYELYPDAGDVTYPNDNEFYQMPNNETTPSTFNYSTYYRSWISHDTLGNYESYFIEDMAGVQPNLDDQIHLDPVDFGYDHFMVNNISYHGKDVTIVWDKPGDGVQYYGDIPEGYSIYIGGTRVLTLDSLSGVTYDPNTGSVTGLTDSSVHVTYNANNDMPQSTDVKITDPKTVQEFATSGIYQDADGNVLTNLAQGATVTASYTPSTARAATWASKQRADGTDSTSKGVNEMAPSTQAVTDGMTVDQPFWGNDQSTNATDWLVLDLGASKKIDMMNIYFYNDRQTGGYTEPAKYLLEYWDGSSWQQMTDQTRSPAAPQANYNNNKFDPVTTDKVRVTFTNKASHYTAVSEIQLYSEGGARPAVTNIAPTVTLQEDTSKRGNFKTGFTATYADDGMPYDKTPTYSWAVIGQPDGSTVTFSDQTSLTPSLTVSKAGSYTVQFTADDGELSSSASVTVNISASASLTDIAPYATPTSDYTCTWEKINEVNDTTNNPTSSSPGSGHGWGDWVSGASQIGTTHWLEYDWPSPVHVNKNDIYWYDDSNGSGATNGTRVPSSFSFQYKDANGNWQNATMLSTMSDALQTNQYNTVEMAPITTTALRMNVVKRAYGTGALRWKVYNVPTDVTAISTVNVGTETGQQPNLPGTVDATLEDGTATQLPVTWNSITASQLAVDGELQASGMDYYDGLSIASNVYVRSDFNTATINGTDQVEVSTTAGQQPQLPTHVNARYNDGVIDSINNTVTWGTIPDTVLRSVGKHVLENFGTVTSTVNTASHFGVDLILDVQAGTGTDASLSGISVDGIALSGFAPGDFDYTYTLLSGTTVYPTVTATLSDVDASISITQATQQAPDATITVTAADGKTVNMYTVHFETAGTATSSDAYLSGIYVNETALSGFDPNTFNYNYTVPGDTTVYPTVTATASDPNANVFIVQATKDAPTATIEVMATDGVTIEVYYVHFEAAGTATSSDAYLSSVSVGGTGLSGFDPNTLNYRYTVPSGTAVYPTVTAIASDPNANVLIVQATKDAPTATIEVMATDGTTIRIYTIAFVYQSSSGGGGNGNSSSASSITITGTPTKDNNGLTITTASIPSNDLNANLASTIKVSLGDVTVTAPTTVLAAALSGNTSASLSMSQSASPAATQQSVYQIVTTGGATPLSALDISLNVASKGNTTAVHQLSGQVTVSIQLSAAQMAQITDPSGVHLYYYDTSTSPATLTDMNASYDSKTGILSFSTNHFSTYVIVQGTLAATTYAPGISYAAHVQNIGWQKLVTDGTEAGTEHRSLRMEGVQIKLTGALPSGASIVYQAHVQKYGWMTPVADSTLAGTTGKSLRMEALRISLKGLTGYSVKYRAYVQNKGWLDWVTTANGTDISKAAVAGTTGKGLRMEAIEIQIVKIA